jgi:hypothetical protein
MIAAGATFHSAEGPADVDTTVFGSAPNGRTNPIRSMSLSALCFQPECRESRCDRNQSPRAFEKIQAICNGKTTPFAMQGLARTREKPPAQEQWVSMEKQCEEQWVSMEKQCEEQWKTMKNTMEGWATLGCNCARVAARSTGLVCRIRG